jgi:hypothetical protein
MTRDDILELLALAFVALFALLALAFVALIVAGWL